MSVSPRCLAFRAQFVADFSAANQHALRRRDFAVRHHPLKSRALEILDRRRRVGMPQHALRREHDHAACASGAAPACAATENIAPRSTAGRLECCPRPRAADNARCARWNVPAPGPSYPCGSSSPTPEGRSHLSSAALMNWSMMICAPFAKSPNCASHSTSASG